MISVDRGSGSDDMRPYHVEWFITTEARRDVTVTIGGGKLLSLRPGKTAGAIELGSVALVDGLVNTHTHLEFSRLKNPFSTFGRFTDWIRRVVTFRREHPLKVRDAIRAGVDENFSSGTTLIGDIASVGWTWDAYLAANFRGIVFQEVLGLSPERISQQTELVYTHLGDESHQGLCGISPHAPYSTHWDLVSAAVDASIESQRPLAMHIAETTSELELLAAGTGEFKELLIDFGIWTNSLFQESRRPLDYLRLLSKAPRSLIVHGNYLQEDELRYIASQTNMTLVFCPRTHAAFRHTEHPWQRLIQMGGRVALGTDSRASNPDLSLFAELQFLASQHPEVSHLELLKLGSRNGRAALGVPDSDAANFTLIRLAESTVDDPDHDLFSRLNHVCGTMIDGEWRHDKLHDGK